MQIEPYWIKGSWPGKLAIIPRPRGGDWLEDDVRFWRQSGIDIAVSLLTPLEVNDLKLTQEEKYCNANDIQFASFPIVDRGVPASKMRVLDFSKEMEQNLESGKTIAIHCRQGIGRSGLIAACLLVLEGVASDEAFQRLSESRGLSVPETTEQKKWVEKFAGSFVKLDVKKS